MNEGRGNYSAASSAVGYFYQCRYALLDALHRLPEGDPISISIETLDDVVFKTGDSAIEILQTKHHINAHANLTDTSPDLWKTLRIWIEGQADGTIPNNAQFFLITTAECTKGTAVSFLRPQGRDEKTAMKKLIATAITSTNETNILAYHAFKAMDSSKRKNLLKSVTVLDSSPSILQLDKELRQAIYHAVERQFLDSFLQRLEGWWFKRVLKHLLEDNVRPILGEEIEAEENLLREQFKEDNLPVDDEIMQATIDASGYLDRPFVEQLNLIGINYNRVVYAIKNYYRAFEHRSRWLRENLLYVGDLERYEDRLIEEWDIMYQQMRDELGEKAAEQAKIQAAQHLYKWIENGTHLPIRSAVTEPAISRGTYQMLADDLRVGWHLEFRNHLMDLISVKEDG